MRTSTVLYPVVSFAALVAAIPEPVIARGGSSCSNGTLSCCNNTYKADQTGVNAIQSLLGVLVSLPVTGPLLATGCTPISVVGVLSGNSCAQQTVCCQGTQFNGLVNVGCDNVNV
ncbi:hypothetical protein SCLCIDRAFT_1036957 [Scleroderma citrinum Foug A]|uniref:Hydrophobin n=1 Tax=Scleroderma citrinum Foug A TaxID=1036808 RepID=A0A0C3DTH1_9AGAM|nr:hypothetical protein SCLCIDRAFT_1036957 [Scleroderma citrinum Foug A]